MGGGLVAATALDVVLAALCVFLVNLWFALPEGTVNWIDLVLRSLMFALLFGAIQVGRILLQAGGADGR